MKEYHKIQTVWLRDPNNNFKTLLEGKWSEPEFEYLKDNNWMFTEKVDGTNIRIHWDGEKVNFGGRTDRAQIPTFLINKLQEMFSAEKMLGVFEDQPMTLYGEGYGDKIQKGGSYIPDGCSFICFDIRIGKWWLKRGDVEDICSRLGVEVVPLLGIGTLEDAIKMVSGGFDSRLRTSPPEGIVMRPACELTTRNGKRIISKLKIKDFKTPEPKEMKMSEGKLKPCPFCGDIPTLTYRMDVGDKELFHDCHVLEDCIDVLEPDAAKRWNTRFQPAEN